MQEYRIDIKVRNNVFLSKLKEAGYNSIGELCRLNNKMHYATVIGEVINMTRSPFQSDGEWRKPILFCAEKLNCAPEDLFTDTQLNTVLKTNKRNIQVNEAEMRFMLETENHQKLLEDQVLEDQIGKEINRQFSDLTLREQKVINMRFGLGDEKKEHSTKEIADVFGVTLMRIRQIEEKALRKLRHPSRSDPLREFLIED